MTITVNGPNGITINFPDGTDQDTIHLAMSQALGGSAPTGQAVDPKSADPQASSAGRSFTLQRQAAPVNPLDVAADARVQKEAAAGLPPLPTPTSAIPFRNDIMAAGDVGLTNYVVNPIARAFGGNPQDTSFDEAKAYQDARDRYVEKTHPNVQLGSDIAGGLAMATSLPDLGVLGEGGALRSIGNTILNGVGYGALYGSGDSSGDGRGANAVSGAETGLRWALPLHFASKVFGNALTKSAADKPPVPPELSRFDPRAVGTVATLAKEDELNHPVFGYPAKTAAMGEQAMLGDMGPNSRAVVAAAAKRTGPETTVAVKSIAGRKAGAYTRITTALNAMGGKPINVPVMIDKMKDAKRAAAGPLYDQFHNTSIPVTPKIRAVLARIPRSAFSEASDLSNREGFQKQFRLRPVDEPMTPMTGVRGVSREEIPTGRDYDYLKRSIDDVAKAPANAGTNRQRVYSDLARDLRTAIDEHLSPGNPNASSWALARRVAGEHLRLEDAMEAGPEAFSKDYSVNQMAYDMRKMSPEERKVLASSARAWLQDRVADMASTKSGENADTALRSLLQSPGAKAKMRLLFGNKPLVDDAIRTLGAETTFDNTYQKVLQNSDTALYKKADERLPGPREKQAALHSLSWEGAVTSVAQKMVDLMSKEHLDARDAKQVSDTIRMLTAHGADRDQIFAGIMKVVNGSNLSPAQRVALERGARHLVTVGAVPAIIDNHGAARHATVHALR